MLVHYNIENLKAIASTSFDVQIFLRTIFLPLILEFHKTFHLLLGLFDLLACMCVGISL